MKVAARGHVITGSITLSRYQWRSATKPQWPAGPTTLRLLLTVLLLAVATASARAAATAGSTALAADGGAPGVHGTTGTRDMTSLR